MSVAAFFSSAHQAYSTAVSRAGSETIVSLDLAGFSLELRFAGASLVEEVTRSLEHLSTADGNGRKLCICLWDEASSGCQLPARPWPLSAHTTRGEVKGIEDSRFEVAYGRGHFALNLLDKATDRALFCTKSAAEVIPQAWAYPLQTILNWWTRDLGVQMAHLGGVGVDGNAVLLAGMAGSGKSATGISCLLEGLEYLGDDHCLLRRDGDLYAYCVYSSGKLEKSFIGRFPALVPHAVASDQRDARKAVVYLAQLFPGRIRRKSRVKAIVAPILSPAEKTRLVPTGLSPVFRSLVTSFLVQTPGAGAAEIRNLGYLLEGVPSYRLYIGGDGAAPRRIRELLGELI
ncbi:MAG: hypothetical protein WAO20_18145 [Acidobacteriota bacterium]